MKTLYTGRATTVAGRAGHTQTDDGKINFDLSPPGSNGPGTNPEQLFACGYSACFGGAVEAVAKKQGIALQEVKISATVSLHVGDDGGFFISAILDAALKGVDQKMAEQLVATAHTVCPYSKATRGNIDVELKVSGQALAA
jgi:lipoyl-dependent peroxiredoxin